MAHKLSKQPSLAFGALLWLLQQGSPAPMYPDTLRVAEIEGSVTVQFRTDARGRPDSATFQVISSTHNLFTAAVLKVLPQWHFAADTSLRRSFVFMMQDKLATFADPTGQSVIITAVRPPSSARTVYFPFQVEKEAFLLPGNAPPHYPDSLREAGIEGEVLAQFVVSADGRPDPSTFRNLKPAFPALIQAAKDALSSMAFSPAQVGGKPVSQFVTMPFTFKR
jgi:TonB family protein